MSLDGERMHFVQSSEALSNNRSNPYNTLIKACNENSISQNQIQAVYQNHRESRNQQQKRHLLSQEFSAFSLDPILVKLLDKDANPGFVDPRNCLVFWARPPRRVRELVARIQKRLQAIAPNLWLMPLDDLHLTVLEIAHSKSEDEIVKLIQTMENKVPDITDFTYDHRARLVHPMLCYDAAAIALSFLPASGESSNLDTDTYTYHHLRRDIWSECSSTGVEIASRYTVPSSHLTIARFITQRDFERRDGGGIDQEKIGTLMGEIEEINADLQDTYRSDGTGGWHVGEEKGLVCRKGTVWYGGGESHYEGKGY
ncbi:hypothetical protein ACLMJK_008201 [Lecanora helva]